MIFIRKGNDMEEKKNIYQKLQSARVKLQQLALKKSGENKFAQFKYYELADFLPSINEIFNELGLFSQFNIVGEVSLGTATLTIVNIESSDQVITFSTPTAEAGVKGTTPVQSLGAVHTYLKRYLYLNALEIVENDVLDASVGSGKLNEKQTDTSKVKKDDALSVRTTELEVVLYGTKYDMTDVQSWLDSFKVKGNSKSDELGILSNQEYAAFKNGIMSKLSKESKERIANGTDTPYDHK